MNLAVENPTPSPADQKPLPPVKPEPKPRPLPQEETKPKSKQGSFETPPSGADVTPVADRPYDPKSKCPGCGDIGVRTLFHAKDRLYHTTDRSFLIVECKACRLIRLEPRPTPDELKHFYPESYWYYATSGVSGKLEQAYRRFVLRDHVNFVIRAIRESEERGLVLDVGCGGGLFLRMMSELGLPVLGLETSIKAAKVAWETNRMAVIAGDLAHSPVVNESCAAVTMFHVLEHLYDPVAYLHSARALLRPNGRLIVQIPNASSWQFLLFGEYWNGVDVPRHLINYRQKDVESLLEYCGFEVLRTKQFSLRDNPAGFASSIAPHLDPMARRVRGIKESTPMKWIKDGLYFALTLGGLPFTLFEAACGAGSTVMIEAKRR